MRSMTKICVICKAEFVPHRPCCVTCSRNCSRINFRRTRRKIKPPREMRNCCECGKEFAVNRMGKLTCSDECSRIRWQKVKESRKISGHVPDDWLDQKANQVWARKAIDWREEFHRTAMADIERYA